MSPSLARTLYALFSLAMTTTHVIAAEPAKTEPAFPPKPGIVVHEDLVYGRVHGAGLLADVAYPERGDKLPAIVSVHGGRWRGGHKRDASTINVQQWAGHGFFAMSIDYRLVGCTPVPACYQDLQCAPSVSCMPTPRNTASIPSGSI